MSKEIRSAWIIAIAVILFAAGLVLPAAADDHVVGSGKRTYMGRTFPPQPSEIWLAADRASVREGVLTIIYRWDLGKQWTIFPRTKKYLEEPIDTSAAPKPEEKPAFRIQEAGWNYQPVYEWSVKVAGETEVIDGRTCRKVIMTGVAEYSEETRTLWLAKDVPIDMARYFEKIVKPGLDPAMAALYKDYPILRESLVVKSDIIMIPPIAPESHWEAAHTTIESVDPPPGTYDIPAGFTKAANRAELFGR